MKFFALLFSVYILALSCIPCGDKDECKEVCKEACSGATSTNPGQNHNETESCSPFCMCACCGQSCNYTFYKVDLGFAPPVVTPEIVVHEPSFVSEVFSSIWKPPKVA